MLTVWQLEKKFSIFSQASAILISGHKTLICFGPTSLYANSLGLMQRLNNRSSQRY